MNIIFLSIDGAQKHREVSKAEPKAARQLRADGAKETIDRVDAMHRDRRQSCCHRS